MPQIFDAHLHIIDPAFPLTVNAGFLPQPFRVADYRRRIERLGIVGGVVVSASFQGFDQAYLLDALERLGPGFVGVTQLPASTPDREIRRLAAQGVKGVRFNLRRGGSESLDQLETLARRVHELVGWHVELYVEGSDLGDLQDRLLRLPAVSIDHLGMSRDGLPALLALAKQGVKVKATGFGRLDFSVVDALRAIHAANPHALMFGTDLPSTRAQRPFADQDFELLVEALGEGAMDLVCWENGVSFYRPFDRPD